MVPMKPRTEGRGDLVQHDAVEQPAQAHAQEKGGIARARMAHGYFLPRERGLPSLR